MLNKIKYAVFIVPAVILAAASAASAQTAFEPATEVTGMATDAVSTMGPIILALGAAVVGLAIASWGVRAVLRTIRSGGKTAG